MGKLSDGIKVARFISFERNIYTSIDKFKQGEASIAGTAFKKISLMLPMAGKYSCVQQLAKLMRLWWITLSLVATVAVNQYVTIVGKVVMVNVSTDVSTKSGKTSKKQDCILRDINGSCFMGG